MTRCLRAFNGRLHIWFWLCLLCCVHPVAAGDGNRVTLSLVDALDLGESVSRAALGTLALGIGLFGRHAWERSPWDSTNDDQRKAHASYVPPVLDDHQCMKPAPNNCSNLHCDSIPVDDLFGVNVDQFGVGGFDGLHWD